MGCGCAAKQGQVQWLLFQDIKRAGRLVENSSAVNHAADRASVAFLNLASVLHCSGRPRSDAIYPWMR